MTNKQKSKVSATHIIKLMRSIPYFSVFTFQFSLYNGVTTPTASASTLPSRNTQYSL